MSERRKEAIRNFAIIAHIDHGKSTLADRLLEITGTVDSRRMREQYLDRMEIERERGITIKLQPVRMTYSYEGEEFVLNLIDTPGHVDFTYEVSRSLAACEGAILVVDATQGVEAQTIANLNLARENGLVIVPFVNKIDLPSGDPEGTAAQLVDLLDVSEKHIIFGSAKRGDGIEELLENVIVEVPPPSGKESGPLRALIFDSVYDEYRGVVIYVRIVDGEISEGDRCYLMAKGKEFEALEVGWFSPEFTRTGGLKTGEVGYVVTNLKEIKDFRVGDTVTHFKNRADEPLPGYKDVKPVVFAGIYPEEPKDFERLRTSLEKLSLNDSALKYEPETSEALGFGFRAGFLGLLHMEIVQERLEREYDLSVVFTLPNVVYEIITKTGEVKKVEKVGDLPDLAEIKSIREPIAEAMIVVTSDYLGDVMDFLTTVRGKFLSMNYMGEKTVVLKYRIPLSEIIADFFDKLKSVSRGYASFDYEIVGYEESDLVRVDVIINGKRVDALSFLEFRDKAERRGREVIRELKKLIPRHLFEVIIQAAVNNRVVARERIPPLRKDVLAKCYGGDVTRKKKLLEKQSKGKKRMKMIGRVEVPQEAFMSVLRRKRSEKRGG